MNTKPILFNTDMVRALLDGRKTMTRRIVKSDKYQPDMLRSDNNYYPTGKVLDGLKNQSGSFMEFRHKDQDDPFYRGSPSPCLIPCPQGQPGDLLWVRETTEVDEDCARTVVLSQYTADRQPVLITGHSDPEYNGSIAHWDYSREVRPSIHMKREHSRLTLRITNVRVERVQEIGIQDALDEGIKPIAFDDNGPYKAFRDLWNSVNGPDAWDRNDWIWVIEFEVIKQNVDEVVNAHN